MRQFTISFVAGRPCFSNAFQVLTMCFLWITGAFRNFKLAKGVAQETWARPFKESPLSNEEGFFWQDSEWKPPRGTLRFVIPHRKDFSPKSLLLPFWMFQMVPEPFWKQRIDSWIKRRVSLATKSWWFGGSFWLQPFWVTCFLIGTNTPTRLRRNFEAKLWSLHQAQR